MLRCRVGGPPCFDGTFGHHLQGFIVFLGLHGRIQSVQRNSAQRVSSVERHCLSKSILLHIVVTCQQVVSETAVDVAGVCLHTRTGKRNAVAEDFTVEMMVSSQTNSCGIYGGRTVFRTGFLVVLWVSPISVSPPTLRTH